MLHAIRLRYRYWFRLDERNLAILITGILVFGLYIILSRASMPNISFKTEDFNDIEFEKFIPPPPKALDKPKVKESKKLETTLLKPTIVDFKMLDQLDDMLKRPDKNLLTTPQTELIPENLQLPDIKMQTNIINDAPYIKRNINASLPILSSVATKVPKINIDPMAIKGDFVPAEKFKRKTNASVIKNKKKSEENIKQVNTQVFDKTKIDMALNELFLKLVSWLKKNETPLTPALKMFLGYKPTDLACQARVKAGTEIYDLFIVCNEISQEIGILLISLKDNSVIYLRDIGFRRESYYLSKGVTVRNSQGQVLSVGTQEEAPTLKETNKFYSIFLSWWQASNP